MSDERKLTREGCRKLFADLGLTYEGLEASDIAALQLMLAASMRECRKKPTGLYHKTWKMSKRIVVKDDQREGIREAYLTCVIGGSERECVSFNRDGFIGFCGDFDDRNAEPILVSFQNWCYLMTLARDFRQLKPVFEDCERFKGGSMAAMYDLVGELRILCRDMHQQIKDDDEIFRDLRECGYVDEGYDGALGAEDRSPAFESRMEALGVARVECSDEDPIKEDE